MEAQPDGWWVDLGCVGGSLRFLLYFVFLLVSGLVVWLLSHLFDCLLKLISMIEPQQIGDSRVAADANHYDLVEAK